MKNRYRDLIKKFANRGPLINIILDGYAVGKSDHTDAIHKASTPFMDYLKKNFAMTKLKTHGKYVGLPRNTDIGGSEVGHLTIGAGKTISQGPTIINEAIKDGSFFERPVLKEAYANAKDSALHLVGLLSDGNIHSHISHFIAVIKGAAKAGVSKCYLHALLDGRDVGIQTADIYVKQVEELFDEIKAANPEYDYCIASAGGREVITMDRDMTWGKILDGWETHVNARSDYYFGNVMEAINYFRKETHGIMDQDLPAFNIKGPKGEVKTIQSGDSVIYMNFRADRAIEMTRAFTEENFDRFPVKNKPKVYFAGMCVYDEDNDVPKNRIIGSPSVDNPFGKRILELGLKQFRLAETQKYAHVTFFFNGGYKQPLDPKMETYHLIESDKIQSFATKPEMKAVEIADQAVKFIESNEYDYGLINFANTDMVGHTGDMNATVIAAETVDKSIERICEAVKEKNGIVVITADHGNADEMLIYNPKTHEEEICTKHSLNPVPFIIFDPEYKEDYTLKQLEGHSSLNLSMIAATNMILLGQDVPEDLNDSLFDC